MHTSHFESEGIYLQSQADPLLNHLNESHVEEENRVWESRWGHVHRTWQTNFPALAAAAVPGVLDQICEGSL